MTTREQAAANIAELPLEQDVTVVDVTVSAISRRMFRFPVPGENAAVEIEIDADPSDEQLETLAMNLPIPDDKRDEAVAVLTADESVVEPLTGVAMPAPRR